MKRVAELQLRIWEDGKEIVAVCAPFCATPETTPGFPIEFHANQALEAVMTLAKERLESK